MGTGAIFRAPIIKYTVSLVRVIQVSAGSPKWTCESSGLRVIKSRDKLELGVTALNLLMDHQGAACHTKPLTVKSVGEEEAKGGVNRGW